MRANMPDDMPLIMRIDAIDEMLPKVTTVEETIQFINWAEEAGVDAMDLSRGNARSLATVYEVPPYNLEPGFNMDNIAAIKKGIHIPVIGVGRVNMPGLADELIREGKIDMIAVGRGQLADPQWCNKAKEGREEDIRRCIGCTEGCYDKVIDPNAKHITCTRNPMLCLEYKGLPKAETPKNVMVIGGGIGGLVTAEFLKVRGHNPTIYEAAENPGGRFVLAGKAPKKQEFAAAVEWEIEQCRKKGIEIKTGTKVTPELIEEVKPDYVIHGDNWKEGPEAAIRANVIEVLEKNGGELIEVPYTYNENVKRVDDRLKEKLAMPEFRRKRLRQLIKMRPIVKTIEVHSGLTGLIAEKTVVENDGEFDQFDAMWISSLCDSTAKGKPDIELVDMTSRCRTIDDVMEVTTKPIIFDGDTGGLTEHFVYLVRTLERMGVSAIIIEDKTGLKKNSLFGTEVAQTQDTIENFSAKIAAGKKVQLTADFMIIARIESLILEQGMEDALNRARAFRDAGADGIMIHSRKKDPAEILEFCDKFRAEDKETPIVVVPSSFNTITEAELAEHADRAAQADGGIVHAVVHDDLLPAGLHLEERPGEEHTDQGEYHEVAQGQKDARVGSPVRHGLILLT